MLSTIREGYLKTFPDDTPPTSHLYDLFMKVIGVETIFRDRLDIDTRSRRIFSFHKPETLQEGWKKIQH